MDKVHVPTGELRSGAELLSELEKAAHSVGPGCLLHSKCTAEGSTLFHDRTLAGRPGS